MDTSVTLERATCWCGTPFMLPSLLLNAARNSGHTIYCPHGHTIVWSETEADKLRRERDRLKQDAARLEEERSVATIRAEKAEAATLRLQKRAASGVCPCCNRTFLNMQRHMKSKHPNVVPLAQKSEK